MSSVPSGNVSREMILRILNNGGLWPRDADLFGMDAPKATGRIAAQRTVIGTANLNSNSARNSPPRVAIISPRQPDRMLSPVETAAAPTASHSAAVELDQAVPVAAQGSLSILGAFRIANGFVGIEDSSSSIILDPGVKRLKTSESAAVRALTGMISSTVAVSSDLPALPTATSRGVHQNAPSNSQSQQQLSTAIATAAVSALTVATTTSLPAQTLGDQIRACLRYVCCCQCFKKC